MSILNILNFESFDILNKVFEFKKFKNQISYIWFIQFIRSNLPLTARNYLPISSFPSFPRFFRIPPSSSPPFFFNKSTIAIHRYSSPHHPPLVPFPPSPSPHISHPSASPYLPPLPLRIPLPPPLEYISITTVVYILLSAVTRPYRAARETNALLERFPA